MLIESALWDPINIARTGRKLGINSDARYRFERGVDPMFMLPGLELATRMVLELCGGAASEVTLAGNPEAPERVIDFPLSELKRLAGIAVPLPEMRRVLERLGFFAAGQGERVKVAVPSWRPDVHGKADIVEEVVRILGVDRVPPTPFDRGEAPRKPVLTPIQARTRKAKRALAVRNLVEAVTWSFVSRAHAELFGGGKPELALANPIAADLSDMRPSPHSRAGRGRTEECRPGLSRCRAVRSRPGVSRRCAAGPVHRRRGGAARARQALRHRPPLDEAGRRGRCVRRQGRCARGSRRGRRAGAGAANRAGRAVLAASRPLRDDPDRPAERARPFRRAASARSSKRLARRVPLVAFEVILERIPEPKAKASRAKPALELSPFQPVERDFAFVVERDVKAADIVRAAASVDRKLITAVSVFDVYEGPGIEPGKKSIAIAVTMQPREKTMTDAEIEALAAKIVAEVGKRTGGVLRA